MSSSISCSILIGQDWNTNRKRNDLWNANFLYDIRTTLNVKIFFQSYERLNLADALVPKQYSDGEQIIRQGDSADGMYFVEDGVVRITILGENGREIEVRIYIIYINSIPRGNDPTTITTTMSAKKILSSLNPVPLISRRLIVFRLAVI